MGLSQHKFRIAVIGLKGLPSYGGAAAVGENILSRLKEDFIFSVYLTKSHTNWNSGIRDGIKYIVFRRFFMKKLNVIYYYFISSLHALVYSNYDLIHIHHSSVSYILYLLRLRYKIIGTSHGLKSSGKWPRLNWYFKKQENIFLKKSTLNSTVSKIEYDLYKNRYSNLFYVPNGINKTEIVPRSNLSPNSYILFSAARIIPIKGCHILLEALRKLNMNVELVIIGDLEQDINYGHKLVNLASNLNVKFVGLIKEKKTLYKYIDEASIFVFPSLMENMSMMLLEVACRGIPIICSDIPENKLIFEEDEVEYYSSGDSTELKRKIEMCLNNYDDAFRKAQKAQIKLINKYEWGDISMEYARLYKKAIMNNTKHSGDNTRSD